MKFISPRSLSAPTLYKLINLWPPFLASGIRIKMIDSNPNDLEVSMSLRFWNRNYVGTHYGGSLYSMCDPFFMFILMDKLGRDYLVWDKAATVNFRKPGTGRVSARFTISDEEVAHIIEKTADGEKYEPEFSVDVLNEDGQVVASIGKTLWVKKKSQK